MVENEIQYVPWRQFQQMVPSIMGLEVSRLTRCLSHDSLSEHDYNLVVKVRFDLRRFIRCVAEVSCEDVQQCSEHLNSALFNALLLPDHGDFDYVIDRIRYVRNRMPYIY